jgi:hypothetical protein
VGPEGPQTDDRVGDDDDPGEVVVELAKGHPAEPVLTS